MRESFILYTDSREMLDALTDEEAGLLFRAIFAYQSGDIESCNECMKDGGRIVMTAFTHFKRYLDNDAEKYEETARKRSEAGKIGNAKRWSKSQSIAKIANAKFATEKIANVADSDSDTDTDINKEKNILAYVPKESAATAVAPTRAQTRYERFLDWLKAECPYIAQHYKLPSEELFTKLLDKYGGEAIAEQCANIENRADIRKRYTNLYQTLNNWLKRETNGNNKDDNAESSREQRAAAVADLITRLRAEDARAG